MATRPWVAPAASRSAPRAPDGVLHIIGDTHYASPPMNAIRKGAWASDLEHIRAKPSTVGHIVVGDFTDAGVTSQDLEAKAAFDASFGPGNWYSAIGNHDIFSRTPAQAAAAYGMPAANFVVDYPAFRLVVISPDGLDPLDDAAMQPLTSSRLNWIVDQCSGSGGRPVVIVCHWSLYDTVGNSESSSTQFRSVDTGFYAVQDAEIRAMLAEVPTAKAWVSGHTHSPLNAANLTEQLTIGGRNFATINASAIAYVGKPINNMNSPLHSLYLMVDQDQLRVHFRNHGAGTWVARSPGAERAWTMAF